MQLRRACGVLVTDGGVAPEKTAESRSEFCERCDVAYGIRRAFFEPVRSVFARHVRCKNCLLRNDVIGRDFDFRSDHAAAPYRTSVSDRRPVAYADSVPDFRSVAYDGVSDNAVLSDGHAVQKNASFDPASFFQSTSVAYDRIRTDHCARRADILSDAARFMNDSSRNSSVFGQFCPDLARKHIRVAVQI